MQKRLLSRVILVAVPLFLLTSVQSASARCIQTVGLERDAVLSLLEKARSLGVRPQNSWDPDYSLFGRDGPYDKIAVRAFRINDRTEAKCFSERKDLQDKITDMIATEALRLAQIGQGGDEALVVSAVLDKYGSFEDDVAERPEKLLLGTGLYCYGPSVYVTDLSDVVARAVNARGLKAEMKIATLVDDNKLKC